MKEMLLLTDIALFLTGLYTIHRGKRAIREKNYTRIYFWPLRKTHKGKDAIREGRVSIVIGICIIFMSVYIFGLYFVLKLFFIPNL